MMIRCGRGHIFGSPRTVKDGGGDRGEYWAVCPVCGDDDLAECGVCTACGETVDERSGDGVLCDACLAKRMDYDTVYRYAEADRPEAVPVNALLAFIFSPAEISAILEREVREVYRLRGIVPQGAETIDRLIRAFAAEDRDAFEAYILRNQT